MCVLAALGPCKATRLSKVHVGTFVNQALHHSIELQTLGAGGGQGTVRCCAQAGVIGCCHTLLTLGLAEALEGGTSQDFVGALVTLWEGGGWGRTAAEAGWVQLVIVCHSAAFWCLYFAKSDTAKQVSRQVVLMVRTAVHRSCNRCPENCLAMLAAGPDICRLQYCMPAVLPW